MYRRPFWIPAFLFHMRPHSGITSLPASPIHRLRHDCIDFCFDIRRKERCKGGFQQRPQTGLAFVKNGLCALFLPNRGVAALQQRRQPQLPPVIVVQPNGSPYGLPGGYDQMMQLPAPGGPRHYTAVGSDIQEGEWTE